MTKPPVFTAVVLAAASAAAAPQPEDYAIRLERVGTTTRVLVVASFTVDEVQGWTWGVCHDPAEAYVAPCGPVSGESCTACADIRCTENLLTVYRGGPPSFHTLSVLENGVTQGVVHNFM